MKKFSLYTWVPGIYFAEVLPNALVTTASMALFTTSGMKNSTMTMITSLIALPWCFKFLWAPLVDLVKTKRYWVLMTEFLLGTALLVIATALYLGARMDIIAWLMLVLAVISATHDIAADGFYLVALTPHEQAAASGVRNIFSKIAGIAGQSAWVGLAGILIGMGWGSNRAWSLALVPWSLVILALACWHWWVMPQSENSATVVSNKKALDEPRNPLDFFVDAVGSFFRQRYAWRALLFLFFYRFAEAQLGKLATPFLLAKVEDGGLGMSLPQQAFWSGTIGAILFLIGSLIAGWAVAHWGFGKCLWPMALAMNLPDLLYFALAYWHPSPLISGIAVASEQFGYGLGYMAHLLFMTQFASRGGPYKTSCFAIMTAIAILGMTLVSMVSGWVQERLSARFGVSHGYLVFFAWIFISTIPSYIAVAFAGKAVDRDYGKVLRKSVAK